MTHGEQAVELLMSLTKSSLSQEALAQCATAHAILALVDAVENLQLGPVPEPEPEPIPFEQTREGWRWEDA